MGWLLSGSRWLSLWECELSVPRADSLRELRNAGLNIKSFSFCMFASSSACLFKHHAQQIKPAVSFQHKTKYQTSSLPSRHDNVGCWLCFSLCLWGFCLFVCLPHGGHLGPDSNKSLLLYCAQARTQTGLCGAACRVSSRRHRPWVGRSLSGFFTLRV